MTNRSEVADTETRYVDRPSATYLLLDPSGATPYAWTSTLTHLSTTRLPEDLRAALAATIPANGAIHRVLAEAHVRTCGGGDWDPVAPLLTGVSPVDLTLAPELVYDADLGLSVAGT
ncbi:MAG: hypothetical protein HGA44_05180 [Cellulomonadaceae bacterium]|nr:hypothetical protein [Cellulomonadaceae bacterium]